MTINEIHMLYKITLKKNRDKQAAKRFTEMCNNQRFFARFF